MKVGRLLLVFKKHHNKVGKKYAIFDAKVYQNSITVGMILSSHKMSHIEQ